MVGFDVRTTDGGVGVREAGHQRIYVVRGLGWEGVDVRTDEGRVEEGKHGRVGTGVDH